MGSKKLVLMPRLYKKKHTYWLTSIMFLWYHLKSSTEVLGNYFLVHIGFFPTLWEVLSSAWLTIFAASIRKNISHRNILGDSWNYMPPILVPSSTKHIATQVFVITKWKKIFFWEAFCLWWHSSNWIFKLNISSNWNTRKE